MSTTLTNPVYIYQAFTIEMKIDFPNNFSNYFQIDATPIHNSSDNQPRVRFLSVVVTFSGRNLPCITCMNTGVLTTYSQNVSAYQTPDSLKWSLKSVKNWNLNGMSAFPTANTIM
jgi:hypothetical protein